MGREEMTLTQCRNSACPPLPALALSPLSLQLLFHSFLLQSALPVLLRYIETSGTHIRGIVNSRRGTICSPSFDLKELAATAEVDGRTE